MAFVKSLDLGIVVRMVVQYTPLPRTWSSDRQGRTPIFDQHQVLPNVNEKYRARLYHCSFAS